MSKNLCVCPRPTHESCLLIPLAWLSLQWVSLFDNINREWMEAVQMVLDYFCERTPR